MSKNGKAVKTVRDRKEANLFSGSADVIDDIGNDLVSHCAAVLQGLANLPIDTRMRTINAIRLQLHKYSPMASEPVDCVLWVKADCVRANDYNPNSVAPPEMELLARSITEDGYTQPIVTWEVDPDDYEVIDGYHRNRVGRENEEVRERVKGYLPITVVNSGRVDRGDRIAATIRHNRARGKHRIDAMSDIVVELKNRNWSNDRIARELGMDQDEVLRLCQITGLTELFSDQQFSKSWDVEGDIDEADFVELTDDVSTFGEEADLFRTVNTSDENRIFHTYEKWECHKAGFYKSSKDGMTKEEQWQEYKKLLTDIPAFSAALKRVIIEWKHSCEHYLTNAAFNRIAWLGQVAVCIHSGVPSECRGGFSLLTDDEKKGCRSNRSRLPQQVAESQWHGRGGLEPGVCLRPPIGDLLNGYQALSRCGRSCGLSPENCLHVRSLRTGLHCILGRQG